MHCFDQALTKHVLVKPVSIERIIALMAEILRAVKNTALDSIGFANMEKARFVWGKVRIIRNKRQSIVADLERA